MNSVSSIQLPNSTRQDVAGAQSAKTVYLHVGYHKTATTFLQRYIYPNMRRINYVGKGEIKKEARTLRYKSISDAQAESIRDHFNSFNDGRPILISFEGFSSSPWRNYETKENTRILRDLRRVYPQAEYDAQVIVSIRAQVALLTSLYVQHLHQGGVMDAGQFLDYCKRNQSLDDFHFNRYLQRIKEIFGKDNLYVMVYEHFKENPWEEMRKLMAYMDEPGVPDYPPPSDNRNVNRGYGTMQVALARKLNLFFKSPLHPNGKLAVFKAKRGGKHQVRALLQNNFSYGLHYRKYALPAHLQRQLKARYREGNRELEEKYGLQLPASYF
jgi:hypothetical protein